MSTVTMETISFEIPSFQIQDLKNAFQYPGPLAPQAKSLTTRPPLLLRGFTENPISWNPL